MKARLTRDGSAVEIGPLDDGDVSALYALFGEAVAHGDGFPHAAPLTPEAFDATWRTPGTLVVAARSEGSMVGAYYLRPNFIGRAAHIANAGYLVGREYRRRGIGRLLVEDSIQRAPALGFDAIQFNLVFRSNPARALYEQLGWREIGRVPDAIGAEPAIIYWRKVP